MQPFTAFSVYPSGSTIYVRIRNLVGGLKNTQSPGPYSRSCQPEYPGALAICVFKKSAATSLLLVPTYIWRWGLDFRRSRVGLGQPSLSLQHQLGQSQHHQGDGSGIKGGWEFEYLP